MVPELFDRLSFLDFLKNETILKLKVPFPHNLIRFKLKLPSKNVCLTSEGKLPSLGTAVMVYKLLYWHSPLQYNPDDTLDSSYVRKKRKRIVSHLIK